MTGKTIILLRSNPPTGKTLRVRLSLSFLGPPVPMLARPTEEDPERSRSPQRRYSYPAFTCSASWPPDGGFQVGQQLILLLCVQKAQAGLRKMSVCGQGHGQCKERTHVPGVVAVSGRGRKQSVVRGPRRTQSREVTRSFPETPGTPSLQRPLH